MSIVPQLFDNLEKEDQSTGIAKTSVLRAYLHIFLIYIQRVYEEVHRHQVATHASALAPCHQGTLILSLRRMNKSITVNQEFCYALVQPSVTYKQLYDYIQGKKG